MPTLVISRGDKNNAVEKMKQFLKKDNNKLCIFPEGIITNRNTLAQFRTGSFNLGYDITPVVIKYNINVYHADPMIFIKNLLSQNEIIADVIILNTERYPFNNDKIEKIRNKMANYGNLFLSRISNREIIDDY